VHLAPTVAGAFADFGGNEKFVRERAEAMPLGRPAVFVLWKDAGQAALSMAQQPSQGRCSSTLSKSTRHALERNGGVDFSQRTVALEA
jgi:uncharacterized membrane protein